jgi:DNA-binding MarR family transcriptional regulator
VDDVRWLEPDQERAWRALKLMQMRLEGELARQLAEESGLSDADYAVLVQLTDRPEGRMRLFELARDLGWEKSRVSHQVARMAGRSLVEKQRCASDRRGAFVAVTERGRAEIAAAAPGHVAAVRRLFVDPLTPTQLAALAGAAEAVIAALDESAGTTVDRPAR